MASVEFQTHVAGLRLRVESALQQHVRGMTWPASLQEAVAYSLMAGGKRLRPGLVLLAAEACGGSADEAMAPALAMEMIHTYSLIHDDLPAMDDDDLRRGRPTSHRVFGEALAILAGDCLLTGAFETIASAGLDAGRTAELTRVLARAAGGDGMVGGQILDLEAERGTLKPSPADRSIRHPERKHRPPAESAERSSATEQSEQIIENSSNPVAVIHVEHLTRIHTMKTGALIQASLEMGAVTARATDSQRDRLRQYGSCIGLAFQIADDLLDVTGDSAKLGKDTGRDVDLGKLTYPALLGIEESRRKAIGLAEQACDLLELFGTAGNWLKELARFIVERDH